MRIAQRVFRYVEHELYNYDNTKQMLEQYKESILESSPGLQEVAVQSGPGDPTAKKALQLVSSAFIAHAEQTIQAIERSLAMLTEDHRKLFKLKYQDCLPWQEVMIELGVSERTYFRMRRELVITVAQQLGLINIE
ncbi:hypothetical protein KVG29_05070 [Caldicoprobacter algeriensis]|uniref:hypothetical protein n=1 Tax=Caldicoprobacter algeriensis TaxID=699281 RepID=UPI0020793B42|nr:hypothetical protein [Caldicoprobacter algeriensis]